MQKFMDELTKLGNQSIAAEEKIAAFETQLKKQQKENKNYTVKGEDPRRGLRRELKTFNDAIYKAENDLVLEIQAALKVKYGVDNEPALPDNFDAEVALLKYAKDAIGVVNPEVNGKYTRPSQFTDGLWPNGPATGVKVHAHHIVIKIGSARVADASYVARQILWANGINPYDGNENLAWAPNWNHNQHYANDVLRELLAVRDKGKTEITAVLKGFAKRFIQGEWNRK